MADSNSWRFQHHSPLDRSSRLKLSKEILNLKEEMEDRGSVDMYRTFHTPPTPSMHSSPMHTEPSKIDDMLGHITCLLKIRRIEILAATFSDMTP